MWSTCASLKQLCSNLLLQISTSQTSHPVNYRGDLSQIAPILAREYKREVGTKIPPLQKELTPLPLSTLATLVRSCSTPSLMLLMHWHAS